MFTLAAPALFAASAVAAALVVGLHLLARHERRAEPLPTARFVPNELASSVVRIDRLRDAALLAVRVAALLLIGLAAARPTWARRDSRTMRVVLVDRGDRDRSREVTDSVRKVIGNDPSVVIAFDSVSETAAAASRVRPDSEHKVPGSISAALIAGLRAAEPMRARYARVELHLVSEVRRGQVDQATMAIRRLWHDSLFVHRLASRVTDIPPPVLDTDLTDDDPIGASARLALGGAGDPVGATVRMRRGSVTAADSTWGSGNGRVLVQWPSLELAAPDTLAAVVGQAASVIGYVTRTQVPGSGTAILWWGDGTVAATESPNGTGCIRTIGFAPSAAGDGALSFAMQRLMRQLAAPCGTAEDRVPLPADEVAALIAPPPSTAAERDGPAVSSAGRPWLAILLLLLGLVMLLADWYLRTRGEEGRGLSPVHAA